jgi:cytidylate kinase
MIITISGLHGTGKSTVGKILSERLGIKYYSTGQAFRDLAQEKHMNIKEFTDYVEAHPEIDIELDNKIINIAHTGDILIDSQLSAYLLKDLADFKILLTCPTEIRISRMSERDDVPLEEKLNETVLRESSELERFKKLYKINLKDPKMHKQLYDLIIDTEKLSINEIVDQILLKIKEKFK